MTMMSEPVAPAVSPIPAGFHTITPSLVVSDAAAAIEFYIKAFGAVDCGRAQNPDGKIMHATIQIGSSKLMLNDEFPDWHVFGPGKYGGSPLSLHLYVEDVDASFAQAVAAGATVTMPLEDQFWGDRYGQVKDPFGYSWSLATAKRQLSEDEIKAAMASGTGCAGE